MNQTTWIVSGGVIIIVLAALLYTLTGNDAKSQKIEIDDQVKAITSPATSSSAVPATQIKNNTPLSRPMNTEPTIVNTTPVKDASTAVPPLPKNAEVVMKTSMGNITLKLYKDDAPHTVENFLKLADSGFYNGVRFHRVIKGFMIQGGDPLSKDDAQVSRWGTGGPGYAFADEINPTSALYKTGYKRGVLAMANSGPDTNGSQFFIMHQDYPLPPSYTIFGEVTAGIDVVDKIATSGTTGSPNNRPLSPITINAIVVAK